MRAFVTAAVVLALAADAHAQEPAPGSQTPAGAAPEPPPQGVAPEAVAPAPVLPRAEGVRSRVYGQPHVMIGVGGVFHELYGIAYGTMSLDLHLGGDFRHFGVYADLMIEAGAALPRLPLEHARAGFAMQYVNGCFRIGAGMRLGGIALQRATRSETHSGFTLSVYAMGSVEVVRWAKRALYLGVEVGIDAPFFGPSEQGATDLDLSPMVALDVGVRF